MGFMSILSLSSLMHPNGCPTRSAPRAACRLRMCCGSRMNDAARVQQTLSVCTGTSNMTLTLLPAITKGLGQPPS